MTAHADNVLQASLRAIKARVAVAVGASTKRVPKIRRTSPAAVLAKTFGLSDFERDVILLAALPALEPDAADLIAKAQGDTRLRLPTVAFAMSTLPDGHWTAFTPDGRLRGAGLIELGDESVPSARSLVLPERVLHHLLGMASVDARLLASAMPLRDEAPLAASHERVALALIDRLNAKGDDPVVQLLGTDRAVASAIAAVAGKITGRPTWLVDSEALPTALAERLGLARLWSLEGRLSKAIPVIDAHDAAGPAELRSAARFASAIAGPVIVLSADTLAYPYRKSERFEVLRPAAHEQVRMWGQSLGPLADRLADPVSRIAAHFTVPPRAMMEIADAVKRVARETRARKLPKATADAHLGDALWAEARGRTRPKLDELAQRIEGRAGWDDLILPPRQRDVLKAIAAQVRQRVQVYEDWGFGEGEQRGLGITALFAGPSGTGKTLAAEVVGAALGLDVYRIDLSAVVSKWIGETEKNLRRVFDAAEDTSAILLFDEADALFGKRSDVKESHDRYANIEVSYLLQRMESYRGLAILTTNLRSHIDQAFLRRIRFLVEFPFPAETERREIWRLAFPTSAPLADIDFARLAQLNVPGGSIKNIALNAAFAAADSDTAIRMAHIRVAAKIEYEKMGKPLTDGELRGWIGEAARA